MAEIGGELVKIDRALSVYQRIGDPISFVLNFGTVIYESGMFGCKNAAQGRTLAMAMMTEGISPFRLKRQYHLIGGDLSMRADAMLAGLLGKGGSYTIVRRTSDNASIKVEIDGRSGTFNLSWKEAQEEPFVYETKDGKPIPGKLKKNWRTPRARMQMLWARVVSDAVRALCPQVVAGTYTPEELVDVYDLDADDYKVIEDQPSSDLDQEEMETVDVEPVDGKPETESSTDKGEPIASAELPMPRQDSDLAKSQPDPAPQQSETPKPPKEEPKPEPAHEPEKTPEPEAAASEPVSDETEKPPGKVTDGQLAEMLTYIRSLGISKTDWKKRVLGRYGVDKAQELTETKAHSVLEILKKMDAISGDHVQMMKELDEWATMAVPGK